MNNDDINKYSSILLDPEQWLKKTDELLEASKLFETYVDSYLWDLSVPNYFIATYFMLCSYALENLFKAAIIQKNKSNLKTKLKPPIRFPDILKGHDLYKLAKKSGFETLAAEEESILRRLTRSATWYGRYPIPLTPKGLNTFHAPNNYDFELSLSAYTTSDRDDIQRIVNEVKSRLATELPKNPHIK